MSVAVPSELYTFIITFEVSDRPIQSVSYHNFFIQVLVLPLTAIYLELTLLMLRNMFSIIAYVLSFMSPKNASFVILHVSHCFRICE